MATASQPIFLSVENIKECENRLHTYIDNNRIHTQFSDLELRAQIYKSMQEVEASPKTSKMTVKAKNNHVLNQVLAIATNNNDQQPQMPKQSSSSVLMRDHEFYGKRPIVTANNNLLPHRADKELRSSAAEHIMQSYDHAMSERAPLMPPEPSRAGIKDPVIVNTLSADDFSKRLQMLESQRATDMQPPAATVELQKVIDATTHLKEVGADEKTQPPPQMQHMQLLNLMQEKQKGPRMSTETVTFHERDPILNLHSADLVHQQQQQQATTVTDTRYLTLSAADRDIVAQPERFRFTARSSGNQDASSLQMAYHDVVWIEATTIVLPMEIVQATGSAVGPKGYYRMEFSFAFQYVTLRIDGFDSNYDGTNDALRRAFAVFIYKRDYKAPNGRGYVVLKPAQKERHEFHSAPLANLRDLTMTILKPNGTLFNGSKDDFTISHMQYETINRLFIKLVVDQYFDRNEFYVGDYVAVQGFKLASRDESVGKEYIAAIETYINRKQGHEIVQLGATNDAGFVNTIYILAPGVMDVSQGRVLVDEHVISVIGALGGGPSDSSAPVYVANRGYMINMSLQPVVTMRIGCERSLLKRRPRPDIIET